MINILTQQWRNKVNLIEILLRVPNVSRNILKIILCLLTPEGQKYNCYYVNGLWDRPEEGSSNPGLGSTVHSSLSVTVDCESNAIHATLNNLRYTLVSTTRDAYATQEVRSCRTQNCLPNDKYIYSYLFV